MLGSLGEDPFGGGVWRRLSGSYPRCGNRRALQRSCAAGSPRASGEEAAGARAGRQPARAQGGGAAAGSAATSAIKALLEVWLYVHVPLTFALIAALTAHIVSVFFYW